MNRRNRQANQRSGQRSNTGRNDRQYDQAILRIPKQKVTLYGSQVFTTSKDASITSDNFTLGVLAGLCKGFNEIFAVHNAVKPLGFELAFSPVDVSSKLAGQISQITATRFNGLTQKTTLTSTSKLIGDTGGRIVYIWPKQNKNWITDLSTVPGGILVSTQGFKQGFALFNVVASLTVVFD